MIFAKVKDSALWWAMQAGKAAQRRDNWMEKAREGEVELRACRVVAARIWNQEVVRCISYARQMT
jgi:hypothetical protein